MTSWVFEKGLEREERWLWFCVGFRMVEEVLLEVVNKYAKESLKVKLASKFNESLKSFGHYIEAHAALYVLA